MNRKSILLLASVILLVSATVIGSIGPVHAQTAYTFVNKFVPPQGVVDINGRRPTCPTSGSFCDLGIPNGGSSFGDLSLIDQVNGTANTFSFKYTLNVTGPSLPVATFTNNGTLTEPASSCALSSCYDRLTHLTAINTTMTISVASAVPHGSYLLNVTAQNGDPTQNKFLLFRIKVYSIAISIDAQSTAATDTTASITAAPLLTFRVGFLVTNATNSTACYPRKPWGVVC